MLNAKWPLLAGLVFLASSSSVLAAPKVTSTNLGQAAYLDPAVVAWPGGGYLDLYYWSQDADGDHTLMWMYTDGSQWYGPTALAPVYGVGDGHPTSLIATASGAREDLLWTDDNGSLGAFSPINPYGWTPLQALWGSSTTSGLGAASWGDWGIDMFYTDSSSGHLKHRTFDYSQCSASGCVWSNEDDFGSAPTASASAMVFDGSKEFAFGNSCNASMTRCQLGFYVFPWNNNWTPSPSAPVGKQVLPGSTPGVAIVNGVAQFQVFYENTTKHLVWYRTATGKVTDLGSMPSRPRALAAASLVPGRVDVFYVNDDGTIQDVTITGIQ